MKKIFLSSAVILLCAACSQPESQAKNPQQQRAADETSVIRPIEGLEIKPREFTVSAEKASTIELPNGGQIDFPANAFVDENGKPVKGSVTIEWQEYHSLADILCSGIPMAYDSAGVKDHFVSGGMFTIDGRQGDKKIGIANGKEAKVALATYDDQEQFNFYRLDEQTGDWDYKLTANSTPNPKASVSKPEKSKEKNSKKEAGPIFLDVQVPPSDSFPELKKMDIIGWNVEASNLPKTVRNKLSQQIWTTKVVSKRNGKYEIDFTSKTEHLTLTSTPVTMDGALKNTAAVEERTGDRWKQLLAFQDNQRQAMAVRTASIPGFGTYNWDCMAKRQNLIAFDLKLTADKDLAQAQCYLISPEDRLIVPFAGTECNDFMFTSDKPNCIVAVTPDKSVYTVSDRQLDAVRKRGGGGEFTFNMESRAEKFTSGRQLERIMQKLI